MEIGKLKIEKIQDRSNFYFYHAHTGVSKTATVHCRGKTYKTTSIRVSYETDAFANKAYARFKHVVWRS